MSSVEYKIEQVHVWLVAHVQQGKIVLPSGWKAELLTEHLPTVSENLSTHVLQTVKHAPEIEM